MTDIQIIADGGAHNNQDATIRQGYFSFKAYANIDDTMHMVKHVERQELPDHASNQLSELKAIEHALEWLYELASRKRTNTNRKDVKVFVDSNYALKHSIGVWQTKTMPESNLASRNRIRELVNNLKAIQIYVQFEKAPRGRVYLELGH